MYPTELPRSASFLCTQINSVGTLLIRVLYCTVVWLFLYWFYVQEPKKLTRFRDNKVVSTKGERFSILTKKDQEGEDMKKTYVSLKPLRKYRFH